MFPNLLFLSDLFSDNVHTSGLRVRIRDGVRIRNRVRVRGRVRVWNRFTTFYSKTFLNHTPATQYFISLDGILYVTYMPCIGGSERGCAPSIGGGKCNFLRARLCTDFVHIASAFDVFSAQAVNTKKRNT